MFIFFDEAGNFDFSPSGTKSLVLGALSSRVPANLLQPLSDLRYQLLAEGEEIERFHASEDKQRIRDRVFGILAAAPGFDFDAVIIEKRKVYPQLHAPVRLYPEFSRHLLKYVFARYKDPSESMILITDRMPLNRKREALEKAFKTATRTELGGRAFSILHHASASHACLLGADYCTWAIYKKWESRELRPFEAIRGLVRSEFDILQRGEKYHY